MLCGQGIDQETLACPNLQIPLVSLKIHGKVYVTCVRSAMLHGTETWGPKEPELWQLHGNDRAMIRWIRGIKDRDETSSASVLQKLGIEDII